MTREATVTVGDATFHRVRLYPSMNSPLDDGWRWVAAGTNHPAPRPVGPVLDRVAEYDRLFDHIEHLVNNSAHIDDLREALSRRAAVLDQGDPNG